MAVLVNAEMEEVDIQPTHRLLRDGSADGLGVSSADPGPVFRAEPMAAGDVGEQDRRRRDADEATFGLLLPGGRGYLLPPSLDAAAERMRRERVSTAVGRLDLASCTRRCSTTGWGSAEAVAAGDRLAYTRDEADARRAVEAAILVRPTRLEQLAAVAMAACDAAEIDLLLSQAADRHGLQPLED